MMFDAKTLYERDRKDYCRTAFKTPDDDLEFVPWEKLAERGLDTTVRFFTEQATRLNHLHGTPEIDDLTLEPAEVPPFFDDINGYYTHDAKRAYTRQQFMDRFGTLGPAISGAKPWERYCYKRMFWRIDEKRPPSERRFLLYIGSTGRYFVTWKRSLAEQMLERHMDAIEVTGIEFYEKHYDSLHSRQQKAAPDDDGLDASEDDGLGGDDGLGDNLEDDGLGSDDGL